jgi:hypothetical protein
LTNVPPIRILLIFNGSERYSEQKINCLKNICIIEQVVEKPTETQTCNRLASSLVGFRIPCVDRLTVLTSGVTMEEPLGLDLSTRFSMYIYADMKKISPFTIRTGILYVFTTAVYNVQCTYLYYPVATSVQCIVHRHAFAYYSSFSRHSKVPCNI